MKLQIRLQQKGKKNHPYWWIVVAPQYKNMFGRNTDHVGFWSPRHNVNIKRQVVLHIPRIMYWLHNGAVPTPKVHHFLTLFGILPKQWHYVKTPQQKAQELSKKKPYEEMTPKEKSLEDRRRKRQERSELPDNNLHRYEAMAMNLKREDMMYKNKQEEANFESKVIRQILQQTDFNKYKKLAELSNNPDEAKPVDQKLLEAKQSLKKLMSELTLQERQKTQSSMLLKSNIIKRINTLHGLIESLQNERDEIKLFQDPQNDQQFITTDYLEKKLKYERITKRFESNLKQLEVLDELDEPVTFNEFAVKIKQFAENNKQQLEKQGMEALMDSDCHELATEIFESRIEELSPITKFDLFLMDHPEYQDYLQESSDESPFIYDVDRNNQFQILKHIKSNEVSFPSSYPVHPRPDLKSYNPDDHYDPIDTSKLDILMIDALDPHEEVERYHRKRNPNQTIADRKAQDQRLRMERLRLVTHN